MADGSFGRPGLVRTDRAGTVQSITGCGNAADGKRAGLRYRHADITGLGFGVATAMKPRRGGGQRLSATTSPPRQWRSVRALGSGGWVEFDALPCLCRGR